MTDPRGQRQETSILVPLRLLRDLLYGPQIEGRYWTARSELRRLVGYEDHTVEELDKER